MTKPKFWTGQPDEPKQTAKKKPSAPKPLMAPAEPIPDEVEVLDEQTTLGDST